VISFRNLIFKMPMRLFPPRQHPPASRRWSIPGTGVNHVSRQQRHAPAAWLTTVAGSKSRSLRNCDCFTSPLTRVCKRRLFVVQTEGNRRPQRSKGVGPLARHHCRSSFLPFALSVTSIPQCSRRCSLSLAAVKPPWFFDRFRQTNSPS